MTPEDKAFNEKFLAVYPRWKFHNCWTGRYDIYGFCVLSFWWSVGGSIGLTILNFAVEFNPHHQKEA